MKTLRFKAIFYSFFIAVTLLFTACEKDAIVNQPTEAAASTFNELPDKVVEQLKGVEANLKIQTEDRYRLLEYSVDSYGERTDRTVSKTGENETIAYGNIANPNSIVFGSVKELSSKGGSVAKSVDDFKAKLIKSTDKAMELTWEAEGRQFKTICYYNDEGIVWDNVIFGLIEIEEDGKIENSAKKGETTDRSGGSAWSKSWWDIKWLWGSKRGEIGYKITVNFNTNGSVRNTDREDWGWMTAGSTKSESRVLRNSGSYGQIQYALGWATPTGSVSFDREGFKVSVSGVGSKGAQNGTKSYP